MAVAGPGVASDACKRALDTRDRQEMRLAGAESWPRRVLRAGGCGGISAQAGGEAESSWEIKTAGESSRPFSGGGLRRRLNKGVCPIYPYGVFGLADPCQEFVDIVAAIGMALGALAADAAIFALAVESAAALARLSRVRHVFSLVRSSSGSSYCQPSQPKSPPGA